MLASTDDNVVASWAVDCVVSCVGGYVPYSLLTLVGDVETQASCLKCKLWDSTLLLVQMLSLSEGGGSSSHARVTARAVLSVLPNMCSVFML